LKAEIGTYAILVTAKTRAVETARKTIFHIACGDPVIIRV